MAQFVISMYEIVYSPDAQKDLAKLKKSEPSSFKKAIKLLDEIAMHPLTGTGHPEPLKGQPEGRWSRKITRKHRLVYRVSDAVVYVEILSAYGHYDDK